MFKYFLSFFLLLGSHAIAGVPYDQTFKDNPSAGVATKEFSGDMNIFASTNASVASPLIQLLGTQGGKLKLASNLYFLNLVTGIHWADGSVSTTAASSGGGASFGGSQNQIAYGGGMGLIGSPNLTFNGSDLYVADEATFGDTVTILGGISSSVPALTVQAMVVNQNGVLVNASGLGIDGIGGAVGVLGETSGGDAIRAYAHGNNNRGLVAYNNATASNQPLLAGIEFGTQHTGDLIQFNANVGGNGFMIGNLVDLQISGVPMFVVTSSGGVQVSSNIVFNTPTTGIQWADGSVTTTAFTSTTGGGGGGSVTGSGAATELAYWTSTTNLAGSGNVTFGSGVLTLSQPGRFDFTQPANETTVTGEVTFNDQGGPLLQIFGYGRLAAGPAAPSGTEPAAGAIEFLGVDPTTKFVFSAGFNEKDDLVIDSATVKIRLPQISKSSITFTTVGQGIVWADGSVSTSAATLGGGVSGSGSSGEVAYWNGADSLTSSSNMVFDGYVLSVTSVTTENLAVSDGYNGFVPMANITSLGDNAILVIQPLLAPGTVSTVAGSDELTGSGTKFLTTFVVGEQINVGSEATQTIQRIISDTDLFVAVTSFSATNSGLQYAGKNSGIGGILFSSAPFSPQGPSSGFIFQPAKNERFDVQDHSVEGFLLDISMNVDIHGDGKPNIDITADKNTNSGNPALEISTDVISVSLPSIFASTTNSFGAISVIGQDDSGFSLEVSTGIRFALGTGAGVEWADGSVTTTAFTSAGLIAGTGTIGYIPVFTSAGAIANSQTPILEGLIAGVGPAYGIGISTGIPQAALDVNGDTFVGGHMEFYGPTPTLGTCGSAVIVGNDNVGRITNVTNSVTTCSIVFANTPTIWTHSPICSVVVETSGGFVGTDQINSVGTGSVSFLNPNFPSGATLSFRYRCAGYR